MKKTKVKEDFINLGKGGWNVAYVRSFKSCSDFVAANQDKTCSGDIDDYLKKVWDMCHKDEQLKAAVNPVVDDTVNEPVNDTVNEPVKKTATKRNSESKKE